MKRIRDNCAYCFSTCGRNKLAFYNEFFCSFKCVLNFEADRYRMLKQKGEENYIYRSLRGEL